jgi:hypothetical protein
MQSVSQHYEDLLDRHYTWMLGDDTEGPARGQRELLERIGIAAPADDAGDSVAAVVHEVHGCIQGPLGRQREPRESALAGQRTAARHLVYLRHPCSSTHRFGV